MKWHLAAMLSAVVVQLAPVGPSDACGIRFASRQQSPRKAVASSSRPSQLLLLGTPPHRLEHDLAAAGHTVEVEPSAADAKKASYAVVITDSAHEQEARTKFIHAAVIVRSGDTSEDMVAIENTVRRPVLRTEHVDPIGSGRDTELHKQVGAGGGNGEAKTQVAGKELSQSLASGGTTNTPDLTKQPTATSKQIATTAPAQHETKPAATTGGDLHDELFFTVGSAKVANKRSLDKDVKWLAGNSAVEIVVEGYADPTGNHDDNMALGQKRAEAVRDYLVEKGVDTARIEVMSYGDTKLKYGKSDGRNRRVAVEKK